MEERYIRNLGALTETECRVLREKRILVAGCGGLGGYVIEMLLRLGVGAVTAVDGDAFEPGNLNRQLLCEDGLMGRSKAAAAAERARRVNPEVEFRAVEAYLTNENAAGLLSGHHAAVDALDGGEARRILARASAQTDVPVIHGAVRGWSAQAALSLPGDGLVERLYPPDGGEEDKSVLSFTPALCAALQCALCARLLCGRPVSPGVLYCADLQTMELDRLKLT